nr:AraC family transcriptional regulator N-terminal domain-containing protein [Nocardia tengchongensis]
MSFDELDALLARHARPDQTTAIDGLHIASITRSGPPTPEMTGTVLAVLARGRKRLAVGDRVHEYRPGGYLVASIDLPVTATSSTSDPTVPHWVSRSSWTLRPSPTCCSMPDPPN